MAGMFGDIELSDATATIPRGTYRIKLVDVIDKEADGNEFGKPTRRFMIFNFEINDDNNPEAEDFNGDKLKGVFLNYWPDMTAAQLKEMEPREKSSFRNSAKLYQILGRAFGFDDDKVTSASLTYEDFKNCEGQFVYADIFTNKQQEMQIQTDKIVNADSVEL